MQGIEMDMYEGVCKYCGSMQPVMAMDRTDANEKISDQCSCGGAERERRLNCLKQNVRMIVGDESVEFGYRQLDKEQERLVEAMVAAVFDGKAEKITLRIENVNISVKDVDGKVKIQRSDTNKTERSA
ncbi:MAG: hypothetical protein HFE75_11460 [Firmicutes bacterium]|jgi:hypothetical protein|nr:hypothetical protein [Bacillota bacterium]